MLARVKRKLRGSWSSGSKQQVSEGAEMAAVETRVECEVIGAQLLPTPSNKAAKSCLKPFSAYLRLRRPFTAWSSSLARSAS